MKIELKFSFTQVADRWVSITVLIGFVLIAAGLMYIALTADVIGKNLAENRGDITDLTP